MSGQNENIQLVCVDSGVQHSLSLIILFSNEIDSLGLLKPLQAYNYELLTSNEMSVAWTQPAR